MDCLQENYIIDHITEVDFTPVLDAIKYKFYELIFTIKNDLGVSVAYNIFSDTDETETHYHSVYMLTLGATPTMYAARYNNANILGLTTGEVCNGKAVIMLDVNNKVRTMVNVNRFTPTTIEALFRCQMRDNAGTLTALKLKTDVANGIGAGSRLLLYGIKGL
jgi:hypothetical protein